MFQGQLKPNAEHYKVTAWLLATTIKCQTNLKGHFKRAHLLRSGQTVRHKGRHLCIDLEAFSIYQI